MQNNSYVHSQKQDKNCTWEIQALQKQVPQKNNAFRSGSFSLAEYAKFQLKRFLCLS